MDARTFDKSKLPSRHVTEGLEAIGLALPASAGAPAPAIFKRTPYIADLKPGGRYAAKDVYDIDGVPQVMRALLDGGYLHDDCLTVAGKTIKQNLENVKFNTDQKVVHPVSNPISPDMISIDAEAGTLDLDVSAAELEQRRQAWKAPPNGYQSGVLRKYADQVGPARKGAVTHAGAAKEVVCYADI